MSDVYVVTKPLQYMVCDLIRGGGDASLIVVNMFFKSKSVYERIKASGRWGRVYFCENRFSSFVAAAFLRPQRLFIDGDIGTRIFLYLALVKLLSPGVKIYVYEEGLGTYRSDIYRISRWRKLKAMFLNRFGVGTHFGGSFFCCGVYVFNPSRYLASVKIKSNFEVNKIASSLVSYCGRDGKILKYLFTGESDFKEKDAKCCIIYLSDWELRDSAKNILLSFDETVFKVVKPHPHIFNYSESWGGADWVVDGSLPAELLILEAVSKYPEVIVFHHGSSVVSYVQAANLKYRLVEIG
ncbi:alpha-2,8-polysialyltransferase family protein [Stutzerimonas stutzeri]|uniref:alpha-2,8-polysialyltransferase family protein n=1 Tax=Stutzerimonas stutzeri TaxID=316 RepID=UPI0021FBB364|nr:alpha-2,8-polysialyltransferase family protein [Stutzerimonas stutzeri]UVO19525.1 alpha-2,8-polysialyltransferase family protein [Stutzerimonas stutzeri]